MGVVKMMAATLVLVVVCGCGVSQSDYEDLKAENERLKSELDECENGADRLVSAVEKAYREKDFAEARKKIELLGEKHPECPKNEEFKALLTTIEKEEIEERKRKEEAETERRRLENLNNTGMWIVNHYVDEFGETTDKAYIANKNAISGEFSNVATQDSPLLVRFLIDGPSRISIMLYEYAGNNPIKAISVEYYSVLMQDSEGQRVSLSAANRSDRLTFNKTDSRKIHNAFMKGGTVKFRLTRRSSSEYEFTIWNADWYENAYRLLKES